MKKRRQQLQEATAPLLCLENTLKHTLCTFIKKYLKLSSSSCLTSPWDILLILLVLLEPAAAKRSSFLARVQDAWRDAKFLGHLSLRHAVLGGLLDPLQLLLDGVDLPRLLLCLLPHHLESILHHRLTSHDRFLTYKIGVMFSHKCCFPFVLFMSEFLW